jgi:excisionase family DNA binding protein
VKRQPTAPVPRVSLTREEAAASLGVSLTTFAERIQPHLKIVRIGSARLIPVRELERWVERHAEAA